MTTSPRLLFLTIVAALRPVRRTRRAVRVLPALAAALFLVMLALAGATEANAQRTAISKSFSLSASASGNFSDVLIFGTNGVTLKRGETTIFGDVVVNDAGFTLLIDRDNVVNGDLKADRVEIKKDAVINGAVSYNVLVNSGGTINGGLNTPLTLPVFDPPPFQIANPRPDAPDVFAPPGLVTELAPGDYGDITVAPTGTLLFSGGLYDVQSLTGGQSSTTLFGAPTDLRILGRLVVGKNSVVGPSAGSGIGASDVIIYAAGVDGPAGFAATIGRDSEVAANIYAGLGTLNLDQGMTATGAFLGVVVIVNKNATIELDSYFNQPPVADPQSVLTNGTEALDIILTGSDPEGADLSFAIVDFPTEGTLTNLMEIMPDPVGQCSETRNTCNADPDCPGGTNVCQMVQPPITSASVTYTPFTGDDKEDSFTFTVTDPEMNTSEPALVQINPNDATPDPQEPEDVVADPKTVEALVDTQRTILLTGTAPCEQTETELIPCEGDGNDVPLTFSIVSGPTSGSLGTLTQGAEVPRRTATVEYTPASVPGVATFVFQVAGDTNDDGDTDDAGETATATVTVNVDDPATPDPDPNTVTANDLQVETQENTPVPVVLTAEASFTIQAPLGKVPGIQASAGAQIQNLIASYPFNGNADDVSGNGLNGTVNGATLTTDRFDIVDSAFSFNGDICEELTGDGNPLCDDITVANDPLFDITDEITLAAWINPSAQRSQVIMRKGAGVGAIPFELALSQTGDIIFSASPGGTFTQARSAGYALNDWTFVVGTYDGQTMKLYVNGDIATTETVSGLLTTNSSPLLIGTRLNLRSSTFGGKLDDLSIYDTALSAQEIEDLLDEGPEPELIPKAIFELQLFVTTLPAEGILTYTDENGREFPITAGDLFELQLPNNSAVIYTPRVGYTGPDAFTFEGHLVKDGQTVVATDNGLIGLTVSLSGSAAKMANHPNPFNPTTTIRFDVAEAMPAKLVVYDVLGRKVRVLVDGPLEAGAHEVTFEAGDLPSGLYLYRLETPQGSFVKTMLLLK